MKFEHTCIIADFDCTKAFADLQAIEYDNYNQEKYTGKLTSD